LEVTVGHRKGTVKVIDFDKQAAQLDGALGDAWYAPDAMQYADGRTPGCKWYAAGMHYDLRAAAEMAMNEYRKSGGDMKDWRRDVERVNGEFRVTIMGRWLGPRSKQGDA
jgi:hypothetical protein